MKLLHAMICAGFACISISQANAQGPTRTGNLKKIQDTGVITIGYRESSVPFSYLDGDSKPIGYTMDLCAHVVEGIRKELNLPELKVVKQPVTASNRIPLIVNGTVDLECGSTTNTADRQQQVAFSVTTFVATVKLMAKKKSDISSMSQLAGKNVALVSGTTAVPLVRAYEQEKGISFREVAAKEYAEGFLLLQSDRVAAIAGDDVLLAGLVAKSKNTTDYTFLSPTLQSQPYAIMLRKGDMELKSVVDKSLTALMRSGEIERMYHKWFFSPIPPSGMNMAFPMSSETKKALANPNDKAE